MEIFISTETEVITQVLWPGPRGYITQVIWSGGYITQVIGSGGYITQVLGYVWGLYNSGIRALLCY